MEKKDYFSRQSKAYAAFRPKYPEALYQFIFSHLKRRSCAWDCGTGNGQVAQYLAAHFDSVCATDISPQQIHQAFPAKNIAYSVAHAETTSFPDHHFDLITVAQALHWFNVPLFYQEVMRTGRPEGLLAVWGYALLTIDPVIDPVFQDFYFNKVGPYWDAARKVVENQYEDVPFPFETIESPRFYIRANWTVDQFAGYLSSWSATEKYIRTLGVDPVAAFIDKFKAVWKPGEVKLVTFPVFMKLGRIP